MPRIFNRIREFNTCTIRTQKAAYWEMECVKGLWSVSGEDYIEVLHAAQHYFDQYKEDGEYHDIIGGDDPLTKLRQSGDI